MSRVALLPTAGCPFTTAFYFHFFEKYWQDEVDRLFIHFNATVEKEVADFCRDLVTKNDKVVFLYENRLLSMFVALTQLVEASGEDHVLFIHDDAIILRRGVVDKYFGMVESGEYDAVGTPRGCCDPLISDQTIKKFKLSEEESKGGPNFWMCFFFCKRSDVDKTDKNFGPYHGFKGGSYVKELDWVVPDVSAPGLGHDVGVWFSIQMRSLGLRFKYTEVKGPSGREFEDYREKKGQFAGDVEWLHLTSLSRSMYSEYIDENDIPIGNRKRVNVRPIPFTPQEWHRGWNHERKAGWWVMIMERFWDDLEPIAEFRDLYRDAVYRYHRRSGLNLSRVNQLATIYKELVKL